MGEEITAIARNALVAMCAKGREEGWEALQALADFWLAEQPGTLNHELSRGDTGLRSNLEELHRTYFLQGVIVAVKAIKSDSAMCEVLWRASERLGRNSPRT